jgi:hypothetical protein
VPRSWNIPHAVDYQRHWRFYYRDSAGKHPMDVSEVRNLFSLSESLSERVRNFRAERVLKIAAGETPVPLEEGAKLVLHLIPLDSFIPAKTVNIAMKEAIVFNLGVIIGESIVRRYNLDGVLLYSTESGTAGADGYTQIFRNGIIEAVDTRIFRARLEDRTPYIPSPGLEKCLADAVKRYLSGLANLEIPPPLFGFITLLGLQGYKLALRRKPPFPDCISPHFIDRNTLEIPELFVEDLTAIPAVILKPAFDALWNAAGWPRCTYYDEDGQWKCG